MEKKRVWCLYRVSAKNQVSADDDIPVQRQACLEFISKKSDWEITNELYEKGVSAWKTKATNRDEMNTIREGAINKELDILLVFLFDRIGRREDESPLVVQFLIEQGVEVWSVQEGEIKIEQHSDILINYIRFWQSAGESKKISLRTREAKKQLSKQGLFQGGRAPLGYKIIKTDEQHWKHKDKMKTELAVDENEMEIVKLIFSMYVDKHMGFRRIADYLFENGYRSRGDRTFLMTTIKRIIINPTYIGKVRFVPYDGKEGDTLPYNEKLRIISDEQFNMAQQILAAKSKKTKDSIQDKTEIPLVGKLMFSGLAFCQYCGSKLTSRYNYKTTTEKDTGVVYTSPVYYYRCSSKEARGLNNHQTVGWGAPKYDKIINHEIKKIFSQLDVRFFIETSVNRKEKEITQKEENAKVLKKEKGDYEKQLEKLNAEIVNSLMGKSKFTPEQLSAALGGIQKKLNRLTEKLDDLMGEIKSQKGNFADENYVASELDNWEVEFDKADDSLKKAMLSRIINKVYLSKGKVKIEFELSLQECLKKMQELSTN